MPARSKKSPASAPGAGAPTPTRRAAAPATPIVRPFPSQAERLQPPQSAAECAVWLIEAQDVYETARAFHASAAMDLEAFKRNAKRMAALAVDALVASGVTKTDAPKRLEEHPPYAEWLGTWQDAEDAETDAADRLAIARNRVNTLRVVAALYAGGAITALPAVVIQDTVENDAHDEVTA